MTRHKDLGNTDDRHNLQVLSNVASEITKTYVQEMQSILKFPQVWLNATGEITGIYVQEIQNILEFSRSLNQRIKSFKKSRKKLKL